MNTIISTLATAKSVDVFCPVCGKLAATRGKRSQSPEKVTDEPCEHLLFVHACDFVYVLPSCKEITETAKAAQDAYGIDAVSHAVKLMDSTAVLCFALEVRYSTYCFAFGFVPADFEEA